MKSLRKRKRLIFENPMNDLLGLFKYISRNLPLSNITMDENGGYILKLNTLEVEYKIQYIFDKGQKDRKKDCLEIRQLWNDNKCVEKIIIEDEYDDEKDWLVNEVLFYLSNIVKDKNSVKNLKKSLYEKGSLEWKSPFFPPEINGLIYEIKKSKFEYFTEDLIRGIQTFDLLNMYGSEYNTNEQLLYNVLKSMFLDVDIKKRLDSILGENVSLKKRCKYLRSKKIDISKSFEFIRNMDKNYQYPQWKDCAYEILFLCKYYSGDNTDIG